MKNNSVLGIILTILLALFAAANAWAIHTYSISYTERTKLLERIDKIERTYVSTTDLKCIMVEVMSSQLDSFELRLQQKYRIIPK